jgi:hypothetical protein
VNSESQIEQQKKEDIEQRTERDRVPHDGWDARVHAVEARPAILIKRVELPHSPIVQRFLRFGFGFETDEARVEVGNLLHPSRRHDPKPSP